MAIVRMKRVFLAALQSDRDTLLHELMKLSCVELSSPEETAQGEELLTLLPPGEKIQSNLENEVRKLGNAIEALTRYDKAKKPLFAQRKPVLAEEVKGKINAAQAAATEVAELILRLSELKNEENRLITNVAMLKPYQELEIALDQDSTATTNIVVGTIPATWTDLTVGEAIVAAGVELILQIFESDRENNYVFGLYPKDREEENWNLLKTFGFQKAGFRDIQGTAKDNIQALNDQLAKIEEERQALEGKLTDLVLILPDLKTAYDYFAVELQKQKQSEMLLCSEEAFFVECWVPEKKAEKLEKMLDRFPCYFEIRDPIEGEDPPVLVQNSKLVEPFGAITELYSLPAYNGIDPNPFVAFFYFIFFGLMLGDAGYGALLAIICFALAYKFKLSGFLGRLVLALGMCGISAVISGIAFGSYFGDVVQAVSGTFFGKEIGDLAVWFNIMEDPMKMLAFCFILGGIHLFVGLGLKGYMLIRDGKPLEALYDVVFWYLFIIGPVMLLFMPDLGKWLTIIGAVGLVLTQGRDSKNPIKRIFSGIYSLYGITGYLSDVLSYSRILALGLCSGVIASVFNTMGVLGGRSFIGVVLFIIIFLLATALNLALSGLGAFVHAARLQYVEFFGKFFEPGGRPFTPLKPQTKYIEIINEEA